MRRHAIPRGEVEEDQQDPGTLDMPEELMAETFALRRALDEARDVSEHHLELVVHPDDTEVRLQRRERIVGDLGLRGRHRTDEGRLADIGKADDGDVGHELEFKA